MVTTSIEIVHNETASGNIVGNLVLQLTPRQGAALNAIFSAMANDNISCAAPTDRPPHRQEEVVWDFLDRVATAMGL